MNTKFKKAVVAVAAAASLVVGISSGADAIVGGAESQSGARPYQVSLQSGGEHYCGGTVIDATTIVTAAHCVEGESASGTTIRAGVNDVTSSAGQDVQVASITSHPSYASDELADIAVLKLAKPLALGGAVQSIPLATASQVSAASTGTVSGWGAVSEDGEGSRTLLEAEVPLVADAACSAQVGSDPSTEVCAGGTGTDSCYGDSGGPLVVATSSGPALAGVVSWGEECGGSTPGVYADVPGLTTWVNGVRIGETQTPDAPSQDQNIDGEADEAGFDDAEDAADDADFEYGDDVEFDDADFEYGDDVEFDDAEFDYGDDVEFDDADFDYGDDAEFVYGDDAEFDDGELDDAEGGIWFFLDEDGDLWVEGDDGDLWFADDFWLDDDSGFENE